MELKRRPAANVWQGQEVPQATMELKRRPAANVWQGQEAPGLQWTSMRVTTHLREDRRKGLAFDVTLRTPPVPCDLPAGWTVQGGVEFDCNPGNLSSLPHVWPIEDLQAILGQSGLIWRHRAVQDWAGSFRVAGQPAGGIELDCNLGNLLSLPHVWPIEDLRAVQVDLELACLGVPATICATTHD